MKRLKGKIAIVTSSTRGIGLACAKKLASEGAIVYMGVRRLETTQEICDTCKKDGLIMKPVFFDAYNIDSYKSMVEEVISKERKIDILVNNAGITKDGLILRMKDQDFDDVLNVNLKGTFNTTKFVSQVMFKQKHGKIVNISSVVGLIGNAGQSNYSASKAGVIGFSKSVAKELASRNININVVAPGYIDTDMTKSLPDRVKEEILKSIPMKKIGNPKEVANLVLFLSSNLSDYITGQVINVDGGMVMA